MKKQIYSGRSMAAWQIVAPTVLLFSMGALGSVVAQVTFTPITEGDIVEDTGNFAGADWGDYDNDGYVDLAVSDSEALKTYLYHNDGNDTFSRVMNGIIATDSISSFGPAWADQDNDGDLDLFVATDISVNVFYRNNGDGTFTKETEGDWVNNSESAEHAAWGDYDNDGLVDLYVSTDGNRNFLYHNNGDGTMTSIITAANDFGGHTRGSAWSDFDGDGDVDLFVGGVSKVQFRNDGDGTFTWMPPLSGGVPRPSSAFLDVAFGSADYDNDGDLDVLHTTWAQDRSALLYRNDGNGVFEDVTDDALPSAGEIEAVGAAWGDYDNDGYQDLFIANNLGNNLLYHNEGDGTFTRITEGPLVSESLKSISCSWVDYDNDGDLDLYVSNGLLSDASQSCEFYRSDGGTNNWVVLNLIGTVSNRSAIGAKVWAQATIDGQGVMQLREISGSGNGGSGEGPKVHIGLGDAAVVDALTIEWPSGIVQEMSGIAAKQFLEVEEPTVEPLIGGTPFGVRYWFHSDWFGYYGTAFAPWLLHYEHGAIYRHTESTNESMFIYDDAMGAWWWTSEGLYPYIYVYDPPADNAGTDIESAWVFYFEESKTPRIFGVVDGPNAGSVLFFGP